MREGLGRPGFDEEKRECGGEGRIVNEGEWEWRKWEESRERADPLLLTRGGCN